MRRSMPTYCQRLTFLAWAVSVPAVLLNLWWHKRGDSDHRAAKVGVL